MGECWLRDVPILNEQQREQELDLAKDRSVDASMQRLVGPFTYFGEDLGCSISKRLILPYLLSWL